MIQFTTHWKLVLSLVITLNKNSLYKTSTSSPSNGLTSSSPDSLRHSNVRTLSTLEIQVLGCVHIPLSLRAYGSCHYTLNNTLRSRRNITLTVQFTGHLLAQLILTLTCSEYLPSSSSLTLTSFLLGPIQLSGIRPNRRVLN